MMTLGERADVLFFSCHAVFVRELGKLTQCINAERASVDE